MINYYYLIKNIYINLFKYIKTILKIYKYYIIKNKNRLLNRKSCILLLHKFYIIT